MPAVRQLHDLVPPCFAEDMPGWLPTAVVVLIEAMEPETGDTHLIEMADADITQWKQLGMLVTRTDTVRDRLRGLEDE